MISKQIGKLFIRGGKKGRKKGKRKKKDERTKNRGMIHGQKKGNGKLKKMFLPLRFWETGMGRLSKSMEQYTPLIYLQYFNSDLHN